MSMFQARVAIVTAIEQAKAAWTEYPLQIEYDNKETVDLATLTTPYLCVDIVFLDGQQMDLGANPLTTDYGSIILAAGIKEGGGMNGVLKLLDHFRPYLQMRDDIGIVRTHAAIPNKQVVRRGYCYQPLTIPFWYTMGNSSA